MKVLVVSANAFSKVLNNGKTYEKIFSRFKPEELCQLYTRPQGNSHSDFSFCSSYYSVSESDIINRICMKSKVCGGIVDKSEGNDGSFEKTFNKFKDSKLKNITFLRDFLWKTGVWKTEDLKKWITNQNPDVIFYVAGGASYIYEIANWSSKVMKNIPTVVYYTDDYFLHPLFRSIWAKIQHLRAKHFYPKYIKKAIMRFCIGELMADEYSTYFGVHFNPIMNMVDVAPFNAKQEPSSGKFTITYLGGLHLNRWKMIARFASCVNDIVNIDVYTLTPLTPEIKSEFDKYSIRYCGGITNNEDIQNVISQSDALLHVESDDEYNRHLTMLSVSTKIPEYLISSRPTIGFGPKEVASMRLLSDNNIGIVIPSNSDNALVHSSVKKLVENDEYRNKIIRKAYLYAAKTFDKENVASDFRNKMESIPTSF